LENGENCFNAYNECGLSCNNDNKRVVLHEGFEMMDDFHNNQTDIGFDGKESFEIVNALTDGQFALKIRNNRILSEEGPLENIYTLDLKDEYQLIDIEFSYQCLGLGNCSISFTDDIDDNFDSIFPIWNAQAGDSGVYTMCLEDVPMTLNDFNYNKIQFTASPIFIPTGSFGDCEFVVDDINIYLKDDLLDKEETVQINVFPNPTKDWLHIESTPNNGIIYLLDPLGRIVYQNQFENSIDVSQLAKGIYFITFEFDELIQTHKFLKI